jgi:hypothetical protein
MSMVAWFLYYKIAAGELGERMSGHGMSGSVHGPCVRVQSYSGCGKDVDLSLKGLNLTKQLRNCGLIGHGFLSCLSSS